MVLVEKKTFQLHRLLMNSSIFPGFSNIDVYLKIDDADDT